ncbi:MAG: Na+/H+ antiporter subunit A [Actinomycetaceae bacterium]|nr:Na+/H+ antiporter subunit A [Actinomycetaceae bacterium]
MPALLATFALGALAAPFAMRRGRNGFFLLALIPAAGFAVFVAMLPAVFAGRVQTQKILWVVQLGLQLDIRVDALSAVMGLLVTGVGTLVLVYSGRYFGKNASYLGRFGAVFLAFAGAMLGLVVSDSTIAMYIFWELTTIFSFLLIGHYSDRSSSRRAALQAIVVTTTGGLAMLAGFVVLGESRGGSYSLAQIVDAAQDGRLEVSPTAAVLILVGAMSKSALIPFHFWLPAAMAAPTPVSAYLHAAAMVKAGVYLIARLSPGLAGVPAWRGTVVAVGAATLIVGGYRALKQHDLKLILAFGTVSQLGLITLMVGYGSAQLALAGLMMLTAHALFKSALFLAVGNVDLAMGTRDLRKLSGVGRRMPATAAFACLAVLSMVGFPPFAGYVAKEAALAGLMASPAAWVPVALGSVLTVAYGIRFLWGAFADKDGRPCGQCRTSPATTAPVGVLAVAGLALGLAAPWWSRLLEHHAALYPGHAHRLVLWHGFGAPVVVTIAVFAAGGLMFAARGHLERPLSRDLVPFGAASVYRATTRGLEGLSGRVTAATQRGSLPWYLMTIFVFTAATAATLLIAGRVAMPRGIRAWDTLPQLAAAAVTALAAILMAHARNRIKAVLLLGVSGYGIALVYELYGAPDLALTQVLAETVTLVVFVLVLRRLPAEFSHRPLRRSRRLRAGLAVSVGLLVCSLAAIAAGARTHRSNGSLFSRQAYEFGYGHNIVNVTLVDIRAWDTLGEISVIVVCAVGISSLLFLGDKAGRTDRLRNILGTSDSRVRAHLADAATPARILAERGADTRPLNEGRGRVWLSTVVRKGMDERSVILEVGTRLVFYSIVTVAVFLLFSGHNQPGGGFAAGILTGSALVLRYLAGGRFELGATLPVLPGYLLGGGLVIASTSALFPLLVGGSPLQTALIDFTLPGFGPVHFATALVFDVGVYLVVVGLCLEILRSLGAEVDRHGPGGERYELRPHWDARSELREAMAVEKAAEEAARTAAAGPARASAPGGTGKAAKERQR